MVGDSLLGARVSRAELVARELEREIVDERDPGERLGTKEDLRKRFGVAVATVNEALRLLETRGLIEARPGAGRRSVRVETGGAGRFQPHRARLQDRQHDLRGVPRGPGRARAVDRRTCRSLPPGKRHPRATPDPQGYGGGAGDPVAFFKTDWALHRRIAQLCRNTPARKMYLALIDFLELSLDSADVSHFDGEGLVEVHRDLVDAIDGGEGPALYAAIQAHEPTAHQARLKSTARA